MSDLYFAALKEYPDLRICHAEAGDTDFLIGTDPAMWENAAKQDWDYLDSTVNGAIFKSYKLVPCAPGTPISNDYVAGDKSH